MEDDPVILALRAKSATASSPPERISFDKPPPLGLDLVVELEKDLIRKYSSVEDFRTNAGEFIHWYSNDRKTVPSFYEFYKWSNAQIEKISHCETESHRALRQCLREIAFAEFDQFYTIWKARHVHFLFNVEVREFNSDVLSLYKTIYIISIKL
jgi:hypothetical protein